MARLPFRSEARQVLEDERTEGGERLFLSMRTFAVLLQTFPTSLVDLLRQFAPRTTSIQQQHDFSPHLVAFVAESISLLRQSKEREFDLMEIHSRNVVSVAFVVSICVWIFGLTFSQEVSKLLESLLHAFEFRHCVASLK
jgi:hypothetical protein